MSQPLDGWETAALINCVRERIEGVEALCRTAMDDTEGYDSTYFLAEDVLRELGGGEAMTNWEKYFGTPERAAMVDTNHLFDPYDGYTGRVEVLFGGKRVFEFERQADYLEWLESEEES
ncbi:MAG: hypothetical protein ACLVKI_14550 [Gordonibacter urolithinfaciens]|jgi:hypothetical protein|nr:MAG TPA: hypothetical protein [Caudoviricetes sp.]